MLGSIYCGFWKIGKSSLLMEFRALNPQLEGRWISLGIRAGRIGNQSIREIPVTGGVFKGSET